MNREMQFNLSKKPQTFFSILGSGISCIAFFFFFSLFSFFLAGSTSIPLIRSQ